MSGDRVLDPEVAAIQDRLDEIEKLATRTLCPFCKAGEMKASPSGPTDTFTCDRCGAVALPGRKS